MMTVVCELFTVAIVWVRPGYRLMAMRRLSRSEKRMKSKDCSEVRLNTLLNSVYNLIRIFHIFL